MRIWIFAGKAFSIVGRVGKSRHEEKVDRQLPLTHRIRSSVWAPQFKGLDHFRAVRPRLRSWLRMLRGRASNLFAGHAVRSRAADTHSLDSDQAANEAVDVRMMRRCIELSRAAGKAGELPFAAVICKDGDVIAETTNQVSRDGDVTRHAEIMAISQAQRTLGNTNLQGCTLYSTIEPCPMCSFPIRETRISRVVYAISSPMMGGASRWNVLGDDYISTRMPEAFAAPPEVVTGVLAKEAASVWRRWNPMVWGVIRLRGVFGPS